MPRGGVYKHHVYFRPIDIISIENLQKLSILLILCLANSLLIFTPFSLSQFPFIGSFVKSDSRLTTIVGENMCIAFL